MNLKCLMIVIVMILSGCDENGVVKPGILEYSNDKPIIEAPTSITSSTPTTLEIYTYGGGCTSVDRTDVEINDESADIFPFDRTVDGTCAAILQTLSHSTILTFTTPGTKTVRIHGRRFDFELDEPMEVTISIAVQ